MLRRLSQSAGQGVRHRVSSPSLRAACAQQAPLPTPAHTRPLVSSVLLSNDGYETRQVTELKALLRQRGLPQSGRKLQLIERLKEHDLARAAAPATTASAPRKSSRRAAPRGKDAAAAAESRAPTTNLEAGSVSGFRDVHGNLLARSPTVELEHTASAPGQPFAHGAPVADTFNVRIPHPAPEPEAPQYIPSLKPNTHPSTDSPFIAHVPKVHLVASPEQVSHVVLARERTEHAAANATPSLASDVADLLPTGVRRYAREAFAPLRSVSSAVAELAADSRGLLERDNAVAAPDSSNARPSGRRPLNGDERRGIAVLGGIVLGGLTLGSVFRPRSQAPAPAPAAPAPHYLHGGGIVGAGTRKH